MTNYNREIEKNERWLTYREDATRPIQWLSQPDAPRGEVWRHLLETAQRWLTMLEADWVSQTEVNNLLGIVQANRRRTTPWDYFAGRVYTWAEEAGFQVPTFDTFYAYPKALPSFDETITADDWAKFFRDHFQQQTHKDPNQTVWETGLEYARGWLRLIESSDISKSDLSHLIRKVERGRGNSLEWIFMVDRMYDWSEKRELAHLWSEDTQKEMKALSSNCGNSQ